MLSDDRCRGCAKENRPCQYKGRAVSRRRCSHYEVRGATIKKREESVQYVEWFNRHKDRHTDK